MNVLRMNIPYPKTKWGTLVLAFGMSIVLPVLFFSLLSLHAYLGGGQLICGYIDTSSACGFIAYVINMLMRYLLVTMVTFGLTIVAPTLLFWGLLDFFRKRSD